jgi:hypothetical protein
LTWEKLEPGEREQILVCIKSAAIDSARMWKDQARGMAAFDAAITALRRVLRAAKRKGGR